MKGLLKRISNFFKTKDTNYTSDFKYNSLECEIILGSSIYIPYMYGYKRDMMDHVIVKFTYKNTEDMIFVRDRFINICYKNKINIAQCNGSGNNYILYIASNTNSLLQLIDSIYNAEEYENIFFDVFNQELTNYIENRDSYEEEYPFEFIETKYKSFRHITHNAFDIIGYTHIEGVTDKYSNIGCIWLSGAPGIISDFMSCCNEVKLYNEVDDFHTIKINLSDFIKALEYNNDLCKRYGNGYIDERTITMISSILNNDKKYFSPLIELLSNNDPIDEDNGILLEGYEDTLDEEEEKEISQEEFINAVLDEIING